MHIQGEVDIEARFRSSIEEDELILSCMLQINAEDVLLYRLHAVDDDVLECLDLEVDTIRRGVRWHEEGTSNCCRLFNLLVECLHSCNRLIRTSTAPTSKLNAIISSGLKLIIISGHRETNSGTYSS